MGANLILKDFVNFTSNEADSGGAMRLTHGSVAHVENCTFHQNVARSQAGAIMSLDES